MGLKQKKRRIRIGLKTKEKKNEVKWDNNNNNHDDDDNQEFISNNLK